jgi:hypothetical protein
MTLEMDRKGPILYYINQAENNKKVWNAYNINILKRLLSK